MPRDIKRGKKSPKEPRGYASFDQQRSAAKWRVAGFRANTIQFLNEHKTVMRIKEIELVSTYIIHLEETLKRW
jgi:hypothetical protein